MLSVEMIMGYLQRPSNRWRQLAVCHGNFRGFLQILRRNIDKLLAYRPKVPHSIQLSTCYIHYVGKKWSNVIFTKSESLNRLLHFISAKAWGHVKSSVCPVRCRSGKAQIMTSATLRHNAAVGVHFSVLKHFLIVETSKFWNTKWFLFLTFEHCRLRSVLWLGYVLETRE